MAFHTAYIGIGANLGQQQASCLTAVTLLNRSDGISVTRQSTWRAYPALILEGTEAQPDFLNGVVAIETTLTPADLFAACHSIEQRLGRERPTIRWAARIIDLDLLAYDDVVISTPALTLPHPELHKRRFVLEPLAEIAPTWMHPRLGKTATQLMQMLDQLDSLFDEQIFSEWHNPRDTDYDKL